MLVKSFKKDSYKKMIKHYLKKCDTFSLNNRHNFELDQPTIRVLEVIFNNNNYAKKLLNNYSNEIVEEIKEKYGNHPKLDEILDIRKYLECNKSDSEIRKHFESKIQKAIEVFIYQKRISQIEKKFKCQLIQKYDKLHTVSFRKNLLRNGKKDQRIDITVYLFKLDDISRRLILDFSDNIYQTEAPYNLEDLALYQNGKCILDTISHEGYCDLYCESQEEYEFLKSVGIEFWEDHFVPGMNLKSRNYQDVIENPC